MHPNLGGICCLLCTGKWLQLKNRPQPDKRSADNSVPSNSFSGYQVYSSTRSKNSADHEITEPGAHWPRCEYCNRKTRCFGYCNLCAGRPCSRWCELVTQDTHYCPKHWPFKPGGPQTSRQTLRPTASLIIERVPQAF